MFRSRRKGVSERNKECMMGYIGWLMYSMTERVESTSS